MLNALTIDLEDWYQGLTSTGRQIEQWSNYEDRIIPSCDRLLKIFSQRGIKGTFFVLGYVADQFPELIRQVAKEGHEIALHSYYHQHVCRLTPTQFREDVARGRDTVQEASQKEVIGYRAPMFSINKESLWALDVLYDMGFRYDSSVFPVRNPYYGIPGAPRCPYFPFEDKYFIEFPVATVRYLGLNWPVAGGFYLRLLPYPLIKWGLKRINREGKPAVIYLHPWDLDEDQPCLNPTRRERFTHYYNLQQTERKLQALLDDFSFSPLRDLADHPIIYQ